MIALTLVAALSSAPTRAPATASDAAANHAARDSTPAPAVPRASAPVAVTTYTRLDTIVTLPEVRVVRDRPARGAAARLPTGFVSDLVMGVSGHALETVAEVLGNAPGVRVLQYGGLGAFSTVSLRGAPAGQVSVFLDGAPLSSAGHGVVDLSDLPASAVERIEIYRGSSPFSLGAATPGGAIHLVTLAARERLDARFTRGSFDTWDGRATAGLERGILRAMLHGGYQGSAGDFRYHDDNGTPLMTDDDEISTRVNNRFESASGITFKAAVAMTVRGHSAFTPMPSLLNSSAMPSTHMLIPYFAIVYATCGPNQRGFMLSGGERLRMCGLRPACADCFKYGMHACEQTNVPRTLTPNIRSKRFIGVSIVLVSEIALALLTRISMPPKCSAHFLVASATAFSSRMSTCMGNALPPAATMASAAV